AAIDLVATEIDRGRQHLAPEPAGRKVDDQRIDRQPGHALGRIHGQPDRLLGMVETDDDARLDAARTLVADADDLDAVRAARQPLALLARLEARDDAADLAGTDVENRDDAGAARLRLVLSAEPAHILRPAFFALRLSSFSAASRA